MCISLHLASLVFPPHLFFDLINNCNFNISDVKQGLSLIRNTKSIGPDRLLGNIIFSIK